MKILIRNVWIAVTILVLSAIASSPALAQAILEAAEAHLACTGRATSRTVRELYSWTSVFDRLFAIYRNVVKDYRVQPSPWPARKTS